MRLLWFVEQPDSHGELLLWQVLLAIFEVLRRELHGPVNLRVGHRDRVLVSEPWAFAFLLEVEWSVGAVAHTIELDGWVLFLVN